MIQWSEVVAECGNYKSGFVAIFRKYEGEATDERDGSNRIVKVTQQSFAEHMGITPTTFRLWVRREVDAEYVTTSATKERTAASHANVAKNLASKAPAQLADAIEQAGPAAVEKVYHELRQRREGIDTSTPARKAAKAQASSAVEPLLAMARDDCKDVAFVLNELDDNIQAAIAAGTVSSKTLDEIGEAAARLANTARAGRVFVS